MSDDDRIAKLVKENEELRARVSALEQPKPKAEPFDPGPRIRFDPTEGMSMDRATMAEFAAAVGGGVLNAVVNDRFRSIEPSSIIPKPEVKEEPKAKGTGWQAERPLEMPPGVKIMDQMMDVQDLVDKADRARRLGHKPE